MSMLVAIIDDDETVRSTVRVLFKGAARVVEAASLRAGLALVGATSPDVILLDHRFPCGGGGASAVPALRRASPASALLLLSGDEDVRDLADGAACDGYIDKGAADWTTIRDVTLMAIEAARGRRASAVPAVERRIADVVRLATSRPSPSPASAGEAPAPGGVLRLV